jgi:hypothetical protein
VTIDVTAVKQKLRVNADNAAKLAKSHRVNGDDQEASFQAGRQAAFLTAIRALDAALDEEAQERDANILDEQIGEQAARLGLIGDRIHPDSPDGFGDRRGDRYGTGIDLAAVERLEEFVREMDGNKTEEATT